MYTDVLCEDSSIDLLDIINMEQEISTYYDNIITETDLLNSIYEDQKFIKEADDTLLLTGPTKTDDRSKLKKISDKFIQTIKDLIQRFLERLKQFKNFLIELTKKKEKEKKENTDDNMIKAISRNPDVKVPVVDIFASLNIDKSVIDSKIAINILDSVEETIGIIKNNKDTEIDVKDFKEKASKLKNLFTGSDDKFERIYDLNEALFKICNDIGIDKAYDKKEDKFDISKIVSYDKEECSVREYYNRYYDSNESHKKHIGKSLIVKSKKNDELYKRIEKIQKDANNISNTNPNIKYLKTIAPFVSVLYRAASYEQICIAHLTKALQVHDSNVNKILSIKTNNKRK